MHIDANTRRRLADGFVLVVRVALGCVFLASSLPKLRQPYDFLGSVYGFEMVGAKAGIFVAMVLPCLELLTGICLIGGVCVGGALLAAAVMGAVFTFAIGSALWRHLAISCGCFNPSDVSIIGYSTLIRAVGVLVLAVATYICFSVVTAGAGRATE